MRGRTRSIRLLASLFILLATTGFRPAWPAIAAGLVVTSLADSGPGTLRQAILDANANPGPDTITFAIPGSGGTIILSSGLELYDPGTTIDASGQDIVLDASGMPSGPVLHLQTGSAAFKGFSILGGRDAIVVKDYYCSGTLDSLTLSRMFVQAAANRAMQICQRYVNNVTIEDSVLLGAAGNNGIDISTATSGSHGLGSLDVNNLSIVRSSIVGTAGVRIFANGAGNLLSINQLSVVDSNITGTAFSALALDTDPSNAASLAANGIAITGSTLTANSGSALETQPTTRL